MGILTAALQPPCLKSLKKSLSALKQFFSLTLDNEMRESPISSNRLTEFECNPMPKCQTFNAPMHTNALSYGQIYSPRKVGEGVILPLWIG